MSLFNLKVDYDAASSLVVSLLKENLDDLRKDWEKVYTGKKGKIFDDDPEEDLKQISEHISAIKTILRYYGETQF